MENTFGQIMSQISLENLSAAQLTQALSSIGGGDMQAGVLTIANYFFENGQQQGQHIGLKKGVAYSTIGIVLFCLVKQGMDKRGKIIEEGKHVLEKLKTSLVSDNGIDSISDKSVAPSDVVEEKGTAEDSITGTDKCG